MEINDYLEDFWGISTFDIARYLSMGVVGRVYEYNM